MDTNPQEDTPGSSQDVENPPKKFEVFIGNLKSDIPSSSLVSVLIDYFSENDISVPAFRVHIGQKNGKRKIIKKHAYITVSNDEEHQQLLKLDGQLELWFVIKGKPLKVRDAMATPSVFKPGFAPISPKLDITATHLKNGLKLLGSRSSPNLTSSQLQDVEDNRRPSLETYARQMYHGQVLERTEDRNTEYKKGGGNYMKQVLIKHVRKYVCAFLNSEGGRLVLGVDDNGRVLGVHCDRKQEDIARCAIDGVIKNFTPHVFPELYTIDFIPVLVSPGDVVSDVVDPLLRVIEISVNKPPSGCANTLYENDLAQIYVRRDGSVEGPLKNRQIIDWCKMNFYQADSMSICTDAVESVSTGNNLFGKETCQEDLGDTDACSSNTYAGNADPDNIDLERGSDEVFQLGDLHDFLPHNDETSMKSLRDIIRLGHSRVEKRLSKIERSVQRIERLSGEGGQQYYCTLI